MIDRIVVWVMSLKARASEERGQDIMEYAIITGSIAVVLITAIGFFTGALTEWWTALGDFFGTIEP
jgi:Flp pilus assembly pilin Flp